MKIFQLLMLLAFLPLAASSQSLWSKSDEAKLKSINPSSREIIPNRYHTVGLDFSHMYEVLSDAPKSFSELKSSTVPLPMADGSMADFVIWEAPLMEAPLSAKYPSIKSYKGYKKDDKSVVARFSVGPNGFHAAIKTAEGLAYIDPYSTDSKSQYIVYYTFDDRKDDNFSTNLLCGTADNSTPHHTSAKWGTTRKLDGKMELRKYRLALGCTGEWGAVRGTKEKALADMVTFVERANIVFETELAITAVLIARNDELIFLDGGLDPYTNPDRGLEILGQNTNILNGRVGSSSYEIGHVFSICYDVGGVAGGNICTPAKGAGVTCHNGNAVSNGIVLVFNHEVGHQMTAAHTFNNCPGQEGQQSSSGYEPGSGSTIMAYPGACGTSNLGVARDDYYHVASLEQMLTFTNSEGADAYDCAEKIDINNFVPVISMPYTNGFSIPKETPFFLKATAIDDNGDNMTYNWEQFDNQTSSPLGSPTGNAPIFRSLPPGSNSARYFPNVSRILNGQFTDKTELLPSYGREMTFRFVVRDNNPLGNAAVWEEMKFKVAANAGPFKLTYPVLDYKWKIGQELNVTWDVAGTDTAPVNCKTVDIYVALSNSLDFQSSNLILVSKSTPNDGVEKIIVPNKEAIRARIVVKASDNIFLTTGLYNSKIDVPETPAFFMDIAEPIKKICLPESVDYSITTAGFAGISEKIKFEVVSGLPDGAVATFSTPESTAGESNSLNLDLSNVSGTADYQIVVRAFAPGIDTIERTIQLAITSTNLDDVKLVGPENGLSGVGPTQKYLWEEKSDATGYELEVATSPDFAPEKIVISKSTSMPGLNSNTFLEKATIYYWRVRSFNACRNGTWSKTFAFNTEALVCKVSESGDLNIGISPSGTPKVEAELNIFTEGIISDVNIKSIKGNHQWSGDVVAYLNAPDGKEVLLWNRKCGSSKGFNVGIDDQSNEFFQCPINTGRIYRPESPLSVLNGSAMKGKWTLRLEDKASGNGGKLTNFNLELCSSLALNPPVLTRNETLKIHPKDAKDIDRVLLLAEDTDNNANELTYTLVSTPLKGLLTLNGAPLSVGNEYRQFDIDNFKLRYLHTADDESDDSFSFVITDGKGGWVSITNFEIDVDAAVPSGIANSDKTERILVYPNPANDVIHILAPDNIEGPTQYVIVDLNGRAVRSEEVTGLLSIIDIESFIPGVYLIKISTPSGAIVRKFVKK